MKLAIQNREAIRRISPALEAELESMMSTISNTFTQEHTWDGHHTNIRVDSIRTPTIVEKNSAGLSPSVTNIETANQTTLPSSFILNVAPGEIKSAELRPSASDIAGWVSTSNYRVTIPGTAPADPTSIVVPLFWACVKTTTGISYGVNRGASLQYDDAGFNGFNLCADLTVDWTTNNRSNTSSGGASLRVFQNWDTRDPRGKGLGIIMTGGTLASGPTGTGVFTLSFKVWYLTLPTYADGTN